MTEDPVLKQAIADLRETLRTMTVDPHARPDQLTGQCLDKLLDLVEHAHVRLDALETHTRRTGR